MTRRSRRELERALAELEPEPDDFEGEFEHFLAELDPETGHYHNRAGDIVDPETESVRVVIKHTIIETGYEEGSGQ